MKSITILFISLLFVAGCQQQDQEANVQTPEPASVKKTGPLTTVAEPVAPVPQANAPAKEEIQTIKKDKNLPKISTKQIDVAPFLYNCMGVAPMQCMKIREEGSVEWELFYDAIDGFDFIEGYEYKLKVQITPKHDVPADASSVQWTLVEVISTQKVEGDKRLDKN